MSCERFAVLVFACITVLVLRSVRINGDGGEYVLMAHAISSHWSLIILPSDFADFERLARAQLDQMAYPLDFYRTLIAEFRTPKPGSYAGFASIKPGELYSMHFWLYSLISAPFHAVLWNTGLNPVAGLALTNLCFLFAAGVYLRRRFEHAWLSACVLFLALGSTFYLRYTGPELMSAACSLIAVLAWMHGRLGTAILAAGLGASQSPSLVLLMPVMALTVTVPALRKQLLDDRARAALFAPPEILKMLAGCLLVAVPYAFFYSIFQVPSLTGKYFTIPEMISFQRLISLTFDLNQGMIAGIPGLFVGMAVAPFLVRASARRQLAVLFVFVVIALLATAIPTLAALNWNSGAVVFMRYAYWLAMPLIAWLVVCMAMMTPGRRRALVLIVLCLQAVVFREHGVFGQRANYLTHSAAAKFALEHFPRWYNPDPEIFLERGLGAEVQPPLATEHVMLYSSGSQARKLLRHRSNFAATARHCPAGQRLEGTDIVAMQFGWEYVHGPFECKAAPQLERLGEISVGSRHPSSAQVLTAGWNGLEEGGVWTQGRASQLVLDIPVYRGELLLRLHGNYFGAQTASKVAVNGKPVGRADLSREPLRLSADQDIPGQRMVIDLTHDKASSPASRGESGDTRQLAFFLRSVRLEAFSKQQ